MKRCLLHAVGFFSLAFGAFGISLAVAQDDPFLQQGGLGGGAAGGFGAIDDGTGAATATPEEELMAQVEALYEEGKKLVAASDLSGAAAKFDEAITASRNTHGPSFFERGKIEREEGFLQQALQSMQYAQAYATAETARDVYLELGELYMELDRAETARDTFQQALAIRPRDPELHYQLGLAQAEFAYGNQFADAESRREDLQTAVASFDLAIKLRPDYADAYFERGTARLSLNLLEEAVEDLRRALELDPRNEKAAAQLGFASLRRGATEANGRQGQRAQIIADYQAAVDGFTRFLSIVDPQAKVDETDPDAIRPENIYINRSAANVGLYEETQGGDSHYLRNAIQDAEAALRLDENLADAHFQKGIALRLLNEMDAAVESFTESLAINPGNSEAHLRRGIIYFREGDYSLAKSDFQDSVRLAVRSPRGSFWLGLTYAKMDMPAEAIEQYGTAIRNQPFFPLAYFNRGLAQMKVGRFERAVSDFDEVLQRDRKNGPARSLRDQALQMVRTQRR